MSRTGGSIRNYIVARVLLTIPMLFILVTVVFVLMRVAPGDPIQAALGGKLPAAQLAARRHAAGYDRPILIQYWEYLHSIATGNFGTSLTDNRTVTSILATNGAATFELGVAAFLVAALVGVPLGLLCGRLRDGAVDVSGRLFGIISYATPVFVLGLIMQLVFTQKLQILPSSGQASPLVTFTMTQHTHILLLDALIDGDWAAVGDVLHHLVLPAVTLGIAISGIFIRLVRSNIIQTLRSDYVEAARARGIGERGVVVGYALRNAMVPVVTVMGLQAALLLSGAVLAEETFNWPGIGQTLVSYLNNRDYTAVQGIVTVLALVVVVISLLIDILTVIIDPRVSYS
ncbi:MAG: ABC transporter permease [bacterium]|jgi:peptide/nickel transport system permease protein|nr:ABC transporter permease [bacterium]